MSEGSIVEIIVILAGFISMIFAVNVTYTRWTMKRMDKRDKLNEDLMNQLIVLAEDFGEIKKNGDKHLEALTEEIRKSNKMMFALCRELGIRNGYRNGGKIDGY